MLQLYTIVAHLCWNLDASRESRKLLGNEPVFNVDASNGWI